MVLYFFLLKREFGGMNLKLKTYNFHTRLVKYFEDANRVLRLGSIGRYLYLPKVFETDTAMHFQ